MTLKMSCVLVKIDREKIHTAKPSCVLFTIQKNTTSSVLYYLNLPDQ
jgi:hypothetical protein